MAGPTRSRAPFRPAALALMAVAVLLASCSGDEPTAARFPGTPSAGATSAAPTTAPESPGSPSSKPPKPSPKPPPKPPAPKPFRLRLDSVRHTVTDRHLGLKKAQRATRKAVDAIRERFEGLFRATYIDPDAWRNARYGPAIQKFFGGGVRKVAGEHLQKLTLGAFAGKEFESVREAGGRLKIDVLIGGGGNPVTAAVRATFTEKAERKKGGTTVVVSDGRYYVSPAKHGWVIQAFRVGRHDHPL